MPEKGSLQWGSCKKGGELVEETNVEMTKAGKNRGKSKENQREKHANNRK